MSDLLGEYAGTADFTTFLARDNNGRPRDDVAQMNGKRVISAQESGENDTLAEGFLKWITGGDKVRARRLYENSWEFYPTAKIWLATNHKPSIRGTDDGIWSRIKLIPFEVSFAGREDRELKIALLDELSGILNWALEGCLLWASGGLNAPQAVIGATREYRDESDPVRRFVEERCVLDKSTYSKAAQLSDAYGRWAAEGDQNALTMAAFGRRILVFAQDKTRVESGIVYRGIRLKELVS